MMLRKESMKSKETVKTVKDAVKEGANASL
jgi:hypothetical protein